MEKLVLTDPGKLIDSMRDDLSIDGRNFSLIRHHIQKAVEDHGVEIVFARWRYFRKQNIAVCSNCSFERKLEEDFGKAISCPNCAARMVE